MSVTKVITLSGSALTEVVPATTSAGVGSAGKLIALNSSGLVDSSMLPTAGGSVTVLDVSSMAAGEGSFQDIVNAFTTVQLSTVNIDTASGWDAGAYTYTTPATGTYLIVTKMRPEDNSTGFISYGQGVNTNSNIDGAWFQWFVTSSNPSEQTSRNGSLNVRILYCTAGTVLNMYAYVDNLGTAVGMTSASMNIVLL